MARLPRPGREFFRREAQKLTKLVESGDGERAIPLVSFVARQMDLRRWFVEAGGGAAPSRTLWTAFRHQEGRFRTIVLGDDNLPYVAEKRLLQPARARRKATLDEAFDASRPHAGGLGRAARRRRTPTSGHRGADQAAFRRTYPFSPALVSTLRTLASAMQRERTALKVMQQLLVDQRDHLTVDDVIPVGDVFDLVVAGQPGPHRRRCSGRFRTATELYDEKLRPLLLREHELTERRCTRAAAESPVPRRRPAGQDAAAVRRRARGARAQGADRGAARLAQPRLDRQPAARAGGHLVLTKVKRWRAEVPEIHISQRARNPVIRVQHLRGRLRVAWSRRPRARTTRAAAASCSSAGLGGIRRSTRSRTTSPGSAARTAVWRGSRREVEVVFGNVRDHTWLADETFKAGTDTWRFVIDYPFDEQGHSVREDDQRVDDLRSAGSSPYGGVAAALPLCRATRELGRLVDPRLAAERHG